MLEAKSKVYDCKREVQSLKLQNQSLLFALFIIRDLKRKKLKLFKKDTNKNRDSGFDKFFNIRINLKDYNRELNKCIHIKLRNYNNGKNSNKLINIKLNLNDYYTKASHNKIINIKMHLKDP